MGNDHQLLFDDSRKTVNTHLTIVEMLSLFIVSMLHLLCFNKWEQTFLKDTEVLVGMLGHIDHTHSPWIGNLFHPMCGVIVPCWMHKDKEATDLNHSLM